MLELHDYMRAWITKFLLGLTLGSVCVLAVACAPTCYLDGAFAPLIPTACHDTQDSNDETVCNWDSGNLSFQEGSGNQTRLPVLLFTELFVVVPDSFYPVFRKINTAFISFNFIISSNTSYLSFVRLII